MTWYPTSFVMLRGKKIWEILCISKDRQAGVRQHTRRVIAEEKKHPIPPSMKRKSKPWGEEPRSTQNRRPMYLTKIYTYSIRGTLETFTAGALTGDG